MNLKPVPVTRQSWPGPHVCERSMSASEAHNDIRPRKAKTWAGAYWPGTAWSAEAAPKCFCASSTIFLVHQRP